MTAYFNPVRKASGHPPPLCAQLFDDNLLFLNQLSQWLAKQPGIHIVGQTMSGEEGIEQVYLLNPDLVVMDLAVPTMRGHEAAQRIKRRSEATRVILMSMHNHETFSENYLLHTDGVVPKDDLYSRFIPLIWALFPGRGFSQVCLSLASTAGA